MNAKSNKKKLYFNFIDVILIVAVLGATLTLVYFLREKRIVTSDNSHTTAIVYQIEVSPMREEFRNLVAVGDIVVDNVTRNTIGEISNVTYSTCYYVGTDPSTGQSISTAYPGKVTMILTIKAKAAVTDIGYEINGYPLTLGDTISLRVPDFTGSGTCISVTKSSDDVATLK